MNDCELDIKLSNKEMERIREILNKDKGLRHYLLKLSDNQELDVVEYKEYENLQQRINKTIAYIKEFRFATTDFNLHSDRLLSILQGEEVK